MAAFHYMLRRTLIPWKPEETIEEALDFCERYGIGEVIWKVDVEEFNHGITPLAMIEGYLPHLRHARDAGRARGIRFSINPWMTHLHCDRGRDMRPVYPDMTFCVDYTGVESHACACSLSEAWQQYLCDAFALYASTRPEILWVEDDIRTFNHAPVEYGCFCRQHMIAFSERVGQAVTREMLVEAMLRPGEPHPWRGEYMTMQGELMVSVLARLEKAVHAVSPETRLGLMTSDPEDHALEGRMWAHLGRALEGPHDLVARPCMACYNEVLPDGLIGVFDIARKTIFCLPDNARICPELENFNYTRFSKSVRSTRLQLGICGLLGARDITMNLFDHMGSPMALDEQYGAMLTQMRPWLDALGDIPWQEAVERGVRILHSPKAPRFTHLPPGATYGDMKPRADGWSYPLQAVGIATTFEPSAVAAVTGQTLRAFDDEQIRELLSSGLLLDASAARVLHEMGYAEHLPARVGAAFCKNDVLLSVEEFFDEAFGGAPGKHMTLTSIAGGEMLARLEVSEGARAISRLVDPDRNEVMPGMVIGENALGGRVAVFPADLSRGATKSFLHWHRQQQLGAVVRWLSRGNGFLQALGGPYLYALRRDLDGEVFVGVANLSLDAAERLQLEIGLPEGSGVRRLLYLHGDGKWREASVRVIASKGNCVRLQTRLSLRGTGLAALRVLLGRR
jgi:hypothetical protein